MFSELEIPSYLGNQIIEAENHLEGLEKASLDLISMTWHAFADNKGNCNYKLDSIQYTLDVVRISSCIQIFHYNPESIEDIHLAHIEPKTRTPKPLSDPYTNDLFWCGLH